MNTNRTTVFLICLFYLTGLFFLLGFMNETISGVDNTDISGTSLGTSFTIFGFTFSSGNTFFGNIVVSIAYLPLWFNTLFIIIPASLMTIFGIMMFIPTIPSG